MRAPEAVDRDWLARHPLPMPPEGGGKEERGRVLVVGGSRPVPGAALLAGVSALRVGAGKLQMAVPRSIAIPLGIAVPEAMVIGLPETDSGGIEAEAASRIVELASKCRALLLGPGMVEDEETAALTVAVLAGLSDVPMVIDAAAMMRLGEEACDLSRHGGRAIVTPHAGEMAGMLGCDVAGIEADPHGTAIRVARDLGAVVVLKGACSFVAAPDGRSFSCQHGNSGLATSGSGDTLAGLMVGALARGAEPVEAAAWAVYLHGEAGNRLAASRGPLGFLAREIPDEVPAVLADLTRDGPR